MYNNRDMGSRCWTWFCRSKMVFRILLMVFVVLLGGIGGYFTKDFFFGEVSDVTEEEPVGDDKQESLTPESEAREAVRPQDAIYHTFDEDYYIPVSTDGAFSQHIILSVSLEVSSAYHEVVRKVEPRYRAAFTQTLFDICEYGGMNSNMENSLLLNN